MTPAVVALTKQLCEALDAEHALNDLYRDRTVVPFELTSIRKRIRVLTADVQAALNAPLKITPWSPWNPGGAL